MKFDLQLEICKELTNDLTLRIEEIAGAIDDKAERNWEIATLLHVCGSLLLSPSLAVARLNMNDQDFRDFKEKIILTIDQGTDEIIDATLSVTQ